MRVPDGTKYDSTLDALKVTQAEYENQRIQGVREVQEKDHIDLTRAPRRDLRSEAKDYVDAHQWFDSFDGATLGAIVEFSDVDGYELTRWQLATDATEALQRMAREAMVTDIVEHCRDIKYQVEGSADA